MASVSIAVFDTKKASDDFVGSLNEGAKTKKYGPLSGFAFDRTYGENEEPTISHPKSGKYFIVVVEP